MPSAPQPIGVSGQTVTSRSWRDPEVVVVAVRHADGVERAAAVLRAVEAGVEDVHRVRVLRIREDVRVVPGALAQPALVVRPLPRRARVVAAIDPAVLRFDEGPDAAGIGGRHPHSPAAPRTPWQSPPPPLLPRVSPVRPLAEAPPPPPPFPA